jgi:hypothetical protein
MIEMELNRIIIDEKRGEQVVVLKEKKGNRRLPIIIGISEASAIKIKVSGIKLPRPLTHDLLNETINHLGGNLEKVVIDNLEANTFYAKLILKTAKGEIKVIDARPSDSIALALRAQAPIFVDKDVLGRVGVLEEH